MSNEADKPLMNWVAVLYYLHIHILGIYSLLLMFTNTKWLTIFYLMGLISISCLGVTVGAHRLWAHRTFKTTFLVRLFFMIGQTLAGVGSVHNWVLYHRMHHKFYGTERDPYNHKKGFVHCYFAANAVAETPEIADAKKEIDMRDMEAETIVLMQKNFYWFFVILGLLVSAYIPYAFWGEGMLTSILLTCCFRLTVMLHVTWLINSAYLVWNLPEGAKLIYNLTYIPDNLRLLYRLYFKMPKSHGTILIDRDGIHRM